MEEGNVSVPKTKLSEISAVQYEGVTEVMHRLTNRYVGEVMQFIETLGLEGKREDAFKSILKRSLWASFDDELVGLQRWDCPTAYEKYMASGCGQSPLPRA